MKKLYLYSWISILIASLLSTGVLANNCTVSNVQRLASDKSLISFDISWENSWYAGGAPKNHDAVWVFVKFLECTGTSIEWEHALLSKNMSHHTLESGISFCRQIDTLDRHGRAGDNYNTGCLIRKTDIGFGNIVNKTCTLKIVGSSTDTAFADSRDYEVRVFAIEMVQVKKGNFSVGDGSTNSTAGSSNRLAHRNLATFDEPYTVYSEDSIATDDAVKLRDVSTGADIWVRAKWPKGYSEYYMMKYEISQGQYGDFLNTLLNGGNRVPGEYGNYRHTLTTTPEGDFGSVNPNRACNFLGYDDVLSYLEWAALRPMSEFEYEKACRGPAGSTTNEFAWGNVNFYDATSVSTPEDGTDTNDVWTTGSYGNANNTYHAIDGTQGPIGVGIFARDATLSREATGGSYYGIMELTGNVAETTIAVSMDAYEGVWGDGMLGPTGKQDTPDWPANPNGRVTGLYRSYARATIHGGDCFNEMTLTVSHRAYQYTGCYYGYGDYYAPQTHVRDWRAGGRGVR